MKKRLPVIAFFVALFLLAVLAAVLSDNQLVSSKSREPNQDEGVLEIGKQTSREGIQEITSLDENHVKLDVAANDTVTSPDEQDLALEQDIVLEQDLVLEKEDLSVVADTPKENPADGVPEPLADVAEEAEVPGKATIVIEGSGMEKSVTLSPENLYAMALETHTYFSRGKEPKESHNTYTGVSLMSLLEQAGLDPNAKRARIIALDGYSATFTINDIREYRIDENDLSKNLPMMIAISEMGGSLGENAGAFRLVMGQQFAGDYNRQYWVKNVCRIIVE